MKKDNTELMEKLNSVAQAYGWEVKGESLYSRKGHRVHDIKIKRDRIHLTNIEEGRLRGSLPVSQPEKLGEYLEKTFYSERINQ